MNDRDIDPALLRTNLFTILVCFYLLGTILIKCGVINHYGNNAAAIALKDLGMKI